MEKNATTNTSVKGMNKDSHPSQSEESQFNFALNANTESKSGDGVVRLQNEISNLPCTDFGDKLVVETLVDITSKEVFFFLSHSDGYSSIVKVSGVENTTYDPQDTIVTNPDGTIISTTLADDLEEDIENKEVENYCTQEVVITDEKCVTPCLNFDIRFPIDALLKRENCGRVIYFTDGINEKRRVEIDNTEQYFFEKVKCDNDDDEDCNCGVKEQSVCFNCEKLLTQPPYKNLCIKFDNLYTGGRLKEGVYHFIAVYSDEKKGAGVFNSISRYMGVTLPIQVKDPNNVYYQTTELDRFTNYGIKLTINNLSLSYNYYRVIGIEVSAIDGAERIFEVGVFSTSQDTVFVDTTINKTVVSSDELSAFPTIYKTARRLATIANKLYYVNLKEHETINLQPIVNFLGEFMKYRIVSAKEDAYKNPSVPKGFMRDEVQPLGIRFTTNRGYVTHLFPLVGRLATGNDKFFNVTRNGITHSSDSGAEAYIQDIIASWNVFVPSVDTDIISVLQREDCPTTDRKYKWQYQNTASDVSPIDSCGGIIEQQVPVTTTQICENVFTETITEEEEIVINNKTLFEDLNLDLEEYLLQGGGTIPAIDIDFWEEEELCEIDEEENCTVSEPTTTTVTSISFASNAIDRIADCSNDNISPVSTVFAKSIIYALDSSNNLVTSPSQTDYVGAGVTFNRNSYLNTSKPNAQLLTEPTLFPLYINPFIGENTVSGYLTSIDADGAECSSSVNTRDVGTCGSVATISDSFGNKIHKGARWYKIIPTSSKTSIKFSAIQDVIENECWITSNVLRVTILNEGDSIIETHCLTNSAKNICINTTINTPIYVVIDTPIVETDITDSKPYVTPSKGVYNISVVNEPVSGYVYTAIGDSSIVINVKVERSFEVTCLVSERKPCVELQVVGEGDFGYWESILNYPNNSFLYDSSSLKIDESDIVSTIKTKFESKFTTGKDGTEYILDEETTNLTCKPIRHFKMPDMEKAPLFSTNRENINILGVHIDNEIINSFLNIAVKNNLITQEFRDSITGYEIFRYDVQRSPSIVAKGLLYDILTYTETNQNQPQLYSNFPFNDISPNSLISSIRVTSNDNGRIKNFTSLQGGYIVNDRFAFHSPETHFQRPPLPFEMKIEGSYIGTSFNSLDYTYRHPKLVLLTRTARLVAITLSALQETLNTARQVADDLKKIGEITGQHPISGLVGAGLYIGAGITYAVTLAVEFSINTYRNNLVWLEIFKNLGTPHNFAATWIAEGKYNNYAKPVAGQRLRGLSNSLYLQSGDYRTTESNISYFINNFNRESSAYLSLSRNRTLISLLKTATTDNSRDIGILTKPINNGSTRKLTIASHIASLKIYNASQHGSIGSLNKDWISTGYCGDLSQDNSCDIVLGGDVFISPLTLKRKFPFFRQNMLNGNIFLPDKTPFAYNNYRNIGYPRTFIDYETQFADDTSSVSSITLPKGYQSDFSLATDFNASEPTRDLFYVTPPSRFLFQAQGVIDFLIETRFNTWYRYAENDRERDFYPNASKDWFQEFYVAIRNDNAYLYNPNFSRSTLRYPVTTMSDEFNPELDSCRLGGDDKIIYTQATNDSTSLGENSSNILDKWQIIKPLDYYNFGNKYGRLISLKAIESDKALALFEDGLMLFGDNNEVKTDGVNILLGQGDLFRQRPTEFVKSDLGYGGTQHYAFQSTPFGHYWVDAKRGRVYNFSKGLEEVSANGMRNWFREHLPFKLLKQFPDLPNEMLDNAKRGLGIAMTWDDRFNRLIVTKRDAVLKPEFKDDVIIRDLDFILVGKGEEEDEVIYITNEEYFEDVSWTIAYHPLLKSWISFHSYIPNYYVSHPNFFQSGTQASGVWSHLLTEKSFQTFYGKKHPFIIEMLSNMSLSKKRYNDIEYKLDTRRYFDNYDFGHREYNFEEIIAYNNREATGKIKMNRALRNNLFQYLDPTLNGYDPINSIINVLSENEDDTWTFNHFFDIVKDNHQLPIITNNKNGVDITLNNTALNYEPTIKNYFRGQWAKIRLAVNEETRLKIIFEYLMNNKLEKP